MRLLAKAKPHSRCCRLREGGREGGKEGRGGEESNIQGVNVAAYLQARPAGLAPQPTDDLLELAAAHSESYRKREVRVRVSPQQPHR